MCKYPIALATLFNELTPQIGAWADQQFDASDARLGVVEETGEVTHCILKRMQRIRGFDNVEHFITKLADGLADTLVYLAHVCWVTKDASGNPLVAGTGPGCGLGAGWIPNGYAAIIATSLRMQADLLEQNNHKFVQRQVEVVLHATSALAQMYEIDIVAALSYTWKKVATRNWRADAVHAAAIADRG